MARVLKFYKHLHSIPKPSLQEFKIAAYEAEGLPEAGIKVKNNLAD